MVCLSFTKNISHLPTPQELLDKISLPSHLEEFIRDCRESIRSIVRGADSRLLLIVGPCSIHDPKSAIEYATRFKKLSEKVQDEFFLVMRCFFEKPRSITGWKGLVYDPFLDGSNNMEQGLLQARQLLADITALQVPIGSEFLEISTAPYFHDLISWGCIGARTTTSQPHRQLASSLTFPVGFKNTTDGNVDCSIRATLSAGTAHTFIGANREGRLTQVHASGNPDCHIVLRGGEDRPNYDLFSVANAVKKCRSSRARDRLLIDCSHDNCRKVARAQILVFRSVIKQIIEGNHSIMGAMLESHLEYGSQPLSSSLDYGVSITDPCIDWKTTESLILEAYAQRKCGIQITASETAAKACKV